PGGIEVGDVNGDGVLDVVTAGQGIVGSPPGRISVLLGKGDGTFAAEIPQLPFVNGWASLALADLNGDGKLDLAVTAFDDTVRIFLGKGDGTFVPHSAVILDGLPLTMRVTEWNGDA